MFEKITTLFHQGGEAVMSSIVFVLLISIVIIIERAFRYWFQYDLPNSEGYMSAVQKMGNEQFDRERHPVCARRRSRSYCLMCCLRH